MSSPITLERMFADAAETIELLDRVVSELDPASLDDTAAIELLDQLDRIERLAAAGKALATARIEAGDAWRGRGSRDAVGFVADRTRTPRARVRDCLAVADLIGSAPVLNQAFRRGELTVTQAADIVAAVTDHPEVEADLVAFAAQVTARELKARCVEICAEGEGADDQHRRAMAERSVSASVGRDGIWRLSARLPVIDGALVDKALDFFQTKIFDEARQQGDRESFDAYRADALVALALAATGQSGAPHESPQDSTPTPNGKPKGKKRTNSRTSSIRHAIVVTVPHTVFQPGGLKPGETCQVPGVGPVPASVVHDLLENDPIIKAVVTRGRDITAVTTLTRTIKEDLRVAVLTSTKLVCAVPGCTNTRFLQLDHEHEYHRGGPTSYDNLRPLCTFHHNQRTRENYELQGKPGSYEWVTPDKTVLASESARSLGCTTGALAPPVLARTPGL